jgi:hypothetical protein
LHGGRGFVENKKLTTHGSHPHPIVQRRKIRKKKESSLMIFLLPHRRCSPLSELAALGLLFVDAGSEELGVVITVDGKKRLLECCSSWFVLLCYCGNLRLLLGRFRTAALEGDAVTLALEALGSDQTLDLGGLGVFLLSLTLGGDGAADDEFSVLSNKLRLASHSITIKCTAVCVFPGDSYLTSSLGSRLKNLRMLVARLGPSLLGLTTSVRPGSSPSPCLTMLRAKTLRSRPVMAVVSVRW